MNDYRKKRGKKNCIRSHHITLDHTESHLIVLYQKRIIPESFSESQYLEADPIVL